MVSLASSGRTVVSLPHASWIDTACNHLYVAPQYDKIEFVDPEQPCTVLKDGVEGVLTETGSFMPCEEAFDYEGYLIGDYIPEFNA